MKKLICFLAFIAISLHAAQMGNIDKISQTFTVKNDFWQCSFIEGSMLPTDFIFADGKEYAGRFFFRDSAMHGKTTYFLNEERRTERRIIENSADKCIIEFEGYFWRNQSPLISKLDGLKVICRYEFARNSDTVKIKFRYEKSNPDKIILRNCNISWYYQNPFDTLNIDGSRTVKLDKGRKHPPYKADNSMTLSNDNYSITITGGKLQCRWSGRGAFPLVISRVPFECTSSEHTFSLKLTRSK